MSYPGYPPPQQGSGQYPAYPPGQPLYPTNPSQQPQAYGSGYPPYPGQPQYGSQPQPYPGQPQPTYPGQPQPSYPGQPQPTYPGQPQPSYPGQPQPSYPGQPQPSYPGQHQPMYPGNQSSPYPSQTSCPYPSQTSSFPQQASTFTSTCSQPGYPNSNMYPSTGGAHCASKPPTEGSYSHAGQGLPAYNKGTPTVRPASPFDPRHDAEVLRKAMKGFGTDEKAIINVLTNRTNVQRQEIAVQFKTMYGKDLISDLKSELTGNFENLIVALITPLPEFQAKELHHAVSGIGTNEQTLVEILCTATNNEIRNMKAAYQRIYGTSLEQDMAGDTSGHFRRLLVSLCQGRRSENYIVDHMSAVNDAQALLRAGELKVGTDESVFNAILCSRSYPQLTQIFLEYTRLTGHDIEKAVKNEFSGDIEAGLVAIVRSVRDKSGFFAGQLYNSMEGMGTRDRALIRIVVTRCEVDMEDIKRSFQHKYGKSLAQFIAEDATGDYEKTLLTLIESPHLKFHKH